MIPLPEHDGNHQVLFLRNVKFTYESGVDALKGVTLEVDSGEYIAVVGGNGSGKTTLAKHMNGLLRPSVGQVVVSGGDSSTMTPAQMARVVGYAFQNPDHQLFCGTVQEEVSFGPGNMGLPADEVKRRADGAIEVMGLSEVRGKPPLSLPLGLRRRVSIASVIAMDPKVFVFDEPTTGLDANEADELMAIIRKLNGEGKAVVLITHEMKLVAEHANRVVVMAEGRIVLDSDTRGAFSDIELLRRSKLLPPPVTQLAHKLSQMGVSRDILTPQELVFELTRGDDD
ncbi:MAG: ATP-binding cassette protein [Candidatus Thermoplasmatota archaeon]|nr:ATP-binding cassette protein [Candidatus Thermoplasmatota archaeon]